MNERLKELMLEAGYAAPELAGRAIKLSELIILECVKHIKRTGILEDIELETDMVADSVKEHFGIKS